MLSGFGRRQLVIAPRFRMLVIISRADTSSINFGIFRVLGFLLVSGALNRCCGSWRGVVMMRIDTIVATLAVALLVEEAWSIMMVLACFAFGARTFKVLFAEQRYVGNRLAPW